MANFLKFLVLFSWFFLAAIFTVSSQQAQTHESARKIVGSIQTMELKYPQQKIYLHLDKDEYIAGETIWMKSYLVNSTGHLPDTMLTNLYIEVINRDELPVNAVLLHSEKGFADGYIELHDSLPEGNYLIRAFTSWMHNFSQDLFFEKEIFVHNPIEENFIRRRELRQNRRFNREIERKAQRVEFHMFPEGGELVKGLENRVAFKAADALGAAVQASGEVVDEDGISVAEFKTVADGMGTFTFSPMHGRSYRAIVDFENGEREKFDLPEALDQGYLLRSDIVNDSIRVEVTANFNPESYDIPSEVIILGQTRSHAYYFEPGALENGVFQTVIPLGHFPTGVCQITLFDAHGLPLAERLLFVNHNDMTPVDIYTRELSIEDFTALEIEIDVDIPETPETWANFSLTVIGSDDYFYNSKSNIASYLLLTSDVDNTIQAPWSYLSDDSPETRQSIDLVMMTSGWRRFNWDKILAGDFPEINYGMASGITIAGMVNPTSSAKPTGEITVEMAIGQGGLKTYSTTTDSEGNFMFSDLFYNDNFMAEFSIPRDPMGRNLRINLLSRDYEDVEFQKTHLSRPTSVVRRGDNWERVKRPQTALTSRWQKPAAEPPQIYGNADQVIHMQDLQANYSTVYEVLRSRATGFMVHDGQVMLRGPSSIRLSSEPLFIIDGIVVHRQVFFNMPPADIDRIEILKGSAAAIYGVRGTNGVILAYTRRGGQESLRTVDYLLTGFQSPRDFAQSVLPTEFYKNRNVEKTIFWAPNNIVNEEGPSTVMIEMPGTFQNMKVVVEGVDNHGNVIFKEYILNQNTSSEL